MKKPPKRPADRRAKKDDDLDLRDLPAPALEDVWANCPKCGWHYKQSKLSDCPMCRHPWRLPVPFAQPPFEGSNLD